VFAILLLPQVAAQTPVLINVKAGSVESMQPAQLYADTEYLVTVKVLDQNGNPVSGSTIEFGSASGLMSIEGSSTAKTDNDGIALLRLKFTAGGVLSLYLDGSKIKVLTVYFQSFPSGASVFLLGTYIIIGLALIYAVYEGPYKTLRKA
jgi:hypothetical protein